MADTETKATTPEQAPEQASATPNVPDSTEQTADKMVPQSELNRVAGTVRIEERKKWEAELAKERKKWETEFTAKVDEERKKAAMTETERLKAEKEAAEKKAQDAMRTANERLLRAEVKATAVALDIVDPDAAYALMDRDAVSVAEDGTTQGVEDALKALIKDKPYLLRQKGAQSVGGATNPAASGNMPGKIYTRAELERMSADEINKHWAEISEQMSKGLIK